MGADIRQEFDKDGNLIKLQSGDSWQADWKRDNTGLELHRQMTGGVQIRTRRDRFGREVSKSMGVRNVEKSSKQYQWGIGNRLQGIYNETTGVSTNFDYDVFDNLIKADYQTPGKVAETIYRMPDAIGDLYQDKNRTDRKYGKGGRLLEDPVYYYHYDVEGNLCFKEFKQQKGFSSLGKEAIEKKHKIKFKGSATGWLYEWSAGGMLRKVVNPEQGKIYFGYDPLGRRVYKEVKGKRICWLWDGNVPLHEWESHSTESLINMVTWVFENFELCAKITNNGTYSIVTDYLGTPTNAYDDSGEEIWERELNIYGSTRFEKGIRNFIPFMYQGQYLDVETGLYYNRFRYYDPSVGNYISQDPIKLKGGSRFYAYVHNPNSWLDIYGLSESFSKEGRYHGPKPKYENPGHHQPGDPSFRGGGKGKTSIIPKNAEDIYKHAIPDAEGKHWYAIDGNGEIHRFGNSNNGKVHWNGSSNQGRGIEVPSDVNKRLRDPNKHVVAPAADYH